MGTVRAPRSEAGICPGDHGKWLRTSTRKEMGPVWYLRKLPEAVAQRPESKCEFCSHQAGEGQG